MDRIPTANWRIPTERGALCDGYLAANGGMPDDRNISRVRYGPLMDGRQLGGVSYGSGTPALMGV